MGQNLELKTWSLVRMWQGAELDEDEVRQLQELGAQVLRQLPAAIATQVLRSPERYLTEVRAALAAIEPRASATAAPAPSPAQRSGAIHSQGDGNINTTGGGITVHGDMMFGRTEPRPAAPPAPPAAKAEPAAEKCRILFLAANPEGHSPLDLEREARDIQAELERTGYGNSFEFVTRWAVEPMGFLRELRKIKPTIVHFSGHGTSAGGAAGAPTARRILPPGAAEAEAPTRPATLVLRGQSWGHEVSAAALGRVFGAVSSPVRLVVLNACYSEEHAAEIGKHVDCVVGMSGEILDPAARAFSVGFYGGLGERETVELACEQGRVAIGIAGLPGEHLPRLRTRPGVNAATLVLGA